jgi:hypothetical protein
VPILTFAAADDVTPRIAQVRRAAINSVKVMREVLDGEADALVGQCRCVVSDR